MMEEKEQQIIQGFNDGYTIQRYEPELVTTLMANFIGVDIPYLKGFISGVKEMILEKELEKSDLFPGMDEDYDLEISDKDLDQDMDLGKDDLDIYI